MQRLLSTLLILVLTLGIAAYLIWHLAFNVGATADDEARLPVLSAPVSIWKQPTGLLSIESTSEADTYAALGYLHGRTRTWPSLLLRQVALGQASRWFGDAIQDLDVFTRQLGLAFGAERAYLRLPLRDKSVLDAYSEGLNTALLEYNTQLTDELVLFDIEPEPWAPWHSLAVERLLAWLATPPIDPVQADSAAPEVRAFLDRDRQLRNWLHIHGFEQSTAWANRDAEGTYVHLQYVFGASALPLFQEVALNQPNGSALALSIPGTPFLTLTLDQQTLQAYFLSSPRRIDRQDILPSAPWPAPTYDRATSNTGHERLVQAFRMHNKLYLSTPPVGYVAATDTTTAWFVTWPGFGPLTDWPQWRRSVAEVTARRVVADTTSGFTLFNPYGLEVHTDGRWNVLGAPRHHAPFADGVLISNVPWAGPKAERLRQRHQSTRSSGRYVNEWADEIGSTWAATVTPRLLSALPDASRPTSITDALAYLQNWDFRYDRASIGASIFDTWIQHVVALNGPAFIQHRLPLDTLIARMDSTLLLQALEHSVTHLSQHHGTDLSLWRWEITQPNQRFYPVWSDSTLHAVLPALHETRYAPRRIDATGHISTPKYHPPLFTDLPAPATWTAWGHTASGFTLNTQQDTQSSTRFLSQYLNTLRARPVTFEAHAENRGQRLVHLRP